LGRKRKIKACCDTGPEKIKNRTDVHSLGEIKGEIVPDSSFDPIFCPLETGDAIEFNSIEFDNEDAYTQMHAMIQWAAKSYSP
jgi:hypothetical protein